MKDELWRSDEKRDRFFLVPSELTMPPGSMKIRDTNGNGTTAPSQWLEAFEITESHARCWAREELGRSLEELKCALDHQLANARRHLSEANRTPVDDSRPVTPNAATMLFELARRLPTVIRESLSKDAHRVDTAKSTFADLHRQLKDAGIDLGTRSATFPDRLAALRAEFDARRGPK